MREKIIFAPPALAPQYLVKVYTMSGMGLTVYSEGLSVDWGKSVYNRCIYVF